MNYLKQNVAFFEMQLTNQLSGNAQLLYYTLFNLNNKCGFKEKFTVSNTTLCAYTKLSVASVQRAREELIENGIITYEKGMANKCGIYHLPELYSDSVVHREQQSEQHFEQQSEQHLSTNPNTLYKDKEKEKKMKENIYNNNNSYSSFSSFRRQYPKKAPLNNFRQPMPDFNEIEELIWRRQNNL